LFVGNETQRFQARQNNDMRGKEDPSFWAGLEIEELVSGRACLSASNGTGCFNGTLIIARNLKVLTDRTWVRLRHFAARFGGPRNCSELLHSPTSATYRRVKHRLVER